MSGRVEVSVVGGSGYVGGELLRLLLFHPQVSVRQVTSARQSGRFVHAAHPTLRGTTLLQFTHPDALDHTDVLFLALPHGEAAKAIDEFADKAERIIDCSADFACAIRRATSGGTEHPIWHPNGSHVSCTAFPSAIGRR